MLSELYVCGIKMKETIPNGSYLSQLPVIKYLQSTDELTFRKPVTFFVGENGAGKSTLIEAMAINLGFNPEGGTVNFNFSTEDSHSDLHKYLTVIKGYRRFRDGFFQRAESFYNVASNIDQMDREPSFAAQVISSYGGVSLHKQSHGESFLALVENRFGGKGLYILDEPEAALSPNGIMRLMCSINKLVKKGSQFIISTHSPVLMTFPDSDVLQISNNEIRSISYKDTEHFQITRQFLNAPERMLKILLDGK